MAKVRTLALISAAGAALGRKVVVANALAIVRWYAVEYDLEVRPVTFPFRTRFALYTGGRVVRALSRLQALDCLDQCALNDAQELSRVHVDGHPKVVQLIS